MTRDRGFQRPYTSDQLTSAILDPLLSVYFVVLCTISLPASALAPVLVPWLLLKCGLVALWVWLGLVDPATEGGYGCRGKTGQELRRYCPSCRKTITGFDHHCTWLNTCIGKRNYAQFYALTFAGLLAYALQTVVGVLAVTVWTDAEDLSDQFGSTAAGRAAWGVHDVVAFGVGSCFASLCSFHTYLVLVVRKGTYDWILDGQRKRDLRRRRRQQDKEQHDATDAAAGGTGNGNLLVGAALPTNNQESPQSPQQQAEPQHQQQVFSPAGEPSEASSPVGTPMV